MYSCHNTMHSNTTYTEPPNSTSLCDARQKYLIICQPNLQCRFYIYVWLDKISSRQRGSSVWGMEHPFPHHIRQHCVPWPWWLLNRKGDVEGGLKLQIFSLCYKVRSIWLTYGYILTSCHTSLSSMLDEEPDSLPYVCWLASVKIGEVVEII